MTLILAAAMAMTMAAPAAAEAENCAAHYMTVGTVVAAGNMKPNATKAEEDAAISLALPWFQRADQVLSASGVAMGADKDYPASVKDKSKALIDQVLAGTMDATAMIGTVGKCDQAYGLQMIQIAPPPAQ